MRDVDRLVESGRYLFRENPGLTEAEFRDRMLERFLADEHGLQEGAARLTADPSPVGAVIGVLLLPVVAYRWLWSRRRLAGHLAAVDEAVRVLRREGHFAIGAGLAEPGAGAT